MRSRNVTPAKNHIVRPLEEWTKTSLIVESSKINTYDETLDIPVIIIIQGIWYMLYISFKRWPLLRNILTLIYVFHYFSLMNSPGHSLQGKVIIEFLSKYIVFLRSEPFLKLQAITSSKQVLIRFLLLFILQLFHPRLKYELVVFEYVKMKT